jgi:glyoxylase-like metal-dependent hydrolase (beta-lactamase superfamily II)
VTLCAGRTTGFIVWINGHGVLVDPPTQTPEFLAASGIHRHLVSKVILTHCHSDHDSGLLRKILEGEKIEVGICRSI